MNDKGQVANDVETEQMLHAGQDRRTGMPLLSSAVQASSKAGFVLCVHCSTGGQDCLYFCLPCMQDSISIWPCSYCGPLCRQETSRFLACSYAVLQGSQSRVLCCPSWRHTGSDMQVYHLPGETAPLSLPQMLSASRCG